MGEGFSRASYVGSMREDCSYLTVNNKNINKFYDKNILNKIKFSFNYIKFMIL